MSKKLLVSDGRRDRELVLIDRITIGRDPACDVSHEDALLSRRHAEFLLGGNEVTVRDLGSRNGIFVNGFRAAERVLHPGDVVQIGPLRVRYVVDAKPAGQLAEQMLADATVMLPTPGPSPPEPVRAPLAIEDDVDKTRVIDSLFQPTPRPAPRVVPPPPPTTDLGLPGDHPTQFVARDRIDPGPPPTDTIMKPMPSSAKPVSRAAAQPGSAPPAVSAAAASDLALTHEVEADIRWQVFMQLTLLAAIVLLGASVPLLMTRDGAAAMPLLWLAVPVVAAVLGIYLVGSAIHARFVRILRVMRLQAAPAPDAGRAAAGASAGLPRV